MVDHDRKYKQKGYQDSGGGGTREKRPASTPRDRSEPRPVEKPRTRTVSRCTECGAMLASGGADGVCAGCGVEIHACTQCGFFDPGVRFQCSKPVTEAVADKRGRNECELFELRASFERDISTAAPARPPDARKGFDDLFKK
ncbi:MAG TPA: hypothetical protein VE404_00370 [Verrucomicrobiae bacterium]|nr:hypothetical protein [Verrucomicrobiae bacterium]